MRSSGMLRGGELAAHQLGVRLELCLDIEAERHGARVRRRDQLGGTRRAEREAVRRQRAGMPPDDIDGHPAVPQVDFIPVAELLLPSGRQRNARHDAAGEPVGAAQRAEEAGPSELIAAAFANDGDGVHAAALRRVPISRATNS